MSFSDLQKMLRRSSEFAKLPRWLSALQGRLPQDKTIRRSALIGLLIVSLYLILIPNLLYEDSVERDLRAARTKNSDLIRLSQEYRDLKRQVDAVESRGSLSRATGAIQAMDDMVATLGLKGRLKNIKGLGSREIKGNMTEEGVELTFEKLSTNELINLLHRVETAPLMISVKSTTIKRSFENQNAVDLILTVALFTKRPSP